MKYFLSIALMLTWITYPLCSSSNDKDHHHSDRYQSDDNSHHKRKGARTSSSEYDYTSSSEYDYTSSSEYDYTSSSESDDYRDKRDHKSSSGKDYSQHSRKREYKNSSGSDDYKAKRANTSSSRSYNNRSKHAHKTSSISDLISAINNLQKANDEDAKRKIKKEIVKTLQNIILPFSKGNECLRRHIIHNGHCGIISPCGYFNSSKPNLKKVDKISNIEPFQQNSKYIEYENGIYKNAVVVQHIKFSSLPRGIFRLQKLDNKSTNKHFIHYYVNEIYTIFNNTLKNNGYSKSSYVYRFGEHEANAVADKVMHTLEHLTEYYTIKCLQNFNNKLDFILTFKDNQNMYYAYNINQHEVLRETNMIKLGIEINKNNEMSGITMFPIAKDYIEQTKESYEEL